MYTFLVKQLLNLLLNLSLLCLAKSKLPVFRRWHLLINQINDMILLAMWRKAWFLMEYILILVAQLCILGCNAILPSGLPYNRPNQSTPPLHFLDCYIPSLQMLLLTQHLLWYFQLPTKWIPSPSLYKACYFYTYSCQGGQKIPPA